MAGRSQRHRGGADRRLASSPERRYPRAARVNEVLREVLAEAIERLADTDDRLTLLTVTGVSVEPDMARATVLFASLSDGAKDALTAARPRLQAAVAGQVRLKRTPQLAFAVDPAVSTGERVEEILRHLHDGEAGHGDQGDEDG